MRVCMLSFHSLSPTSHSVTSLAWEVVSPGSHFMPRSSNPSLRGTTLVSFPNGIIPKSLPDCQKFFLTWFHVVMSVDNKVMSLHVHACIHVWKCYYQKLLWIDGIVWTYLQQTIMNSNFIFTELEQNPEKEFYSWDWKDTYPQTFLSFSESHAPAVAESQSVPAQGWCTALVPQSWD